jgi:hypothetical protein
MMNQIQTKYKRSIHCKRLNAARIRCCYCCLWSHYYQPICECEMKYNSIFFIITIITIIYNYI